MSDAGSSTLDPDRKAVKTLIKEISATGESADGVLVSIRTLTGWICGGTARPVLQYLWN